MQQENSKFAFYPESLPNDLHAKIVSHKTNIVHVLSVDLGWMFCLVKVRLRNVKRCSDR